MLLKQIFIILQSRLTQQKCRVFALPEKPGRRLAAGGNLSYRQIFVHSAKRGRESMGSEIVSRMVVKVSNGAILAEERADLLFYL